MPSIVDGVIDRALQAAVSRARTESPRARELLAALAGRSITVEARGTPFRVTIASDGTVLRVAAPEPGAAAAPDAHISGTPLSLLALTRADPEVVIQRGDVSIEGDAEIAQQFSRLALLLRPDLENALSQVLGRSGAHVLMRGLRGAAAWTRAAARTQVLNLSEYLAHERGDLVPRSEAAQFLREVDDARDQLERLEARLSHLEQDRPA
jgi:ubiquinone biosynthesis accessory factor UbiJ